MAIAVSLEASCTIPVVPRPAGRDPIPDKPLMRAAVSDKTPYSSRAKGRPPVFQEPDGNAIVNGAFTLQCAAGGGRANALNILFTISR